MRNAPATEQGPTRVTVLVRRDPSGPSLDGEPPRVRRAHAAAAAVRTAITAQGASDVKPPTAAIAARRLAARRIRAVLRVAADRVPTLAVVPSPVPLVGRALPLEVVHGILRVTAPQAINVGRVSAARSERVIMAKRPTDAGTGVITADGGAPRHAVTVRVTTVQAVVPKAAAIREVARDPSKGAPCEPRLVPRLLRLRGAALNAEAIELRPRLAIPSARHRHEADGAAPVLGPAAALQLACGEPEGAIDEARAGAATLIVAQTASPLLTVGAVLRGIAGEERVLTNASLEETARHDPVDQPAA